MLLSLVHQIHILLRTEVGCIDTLHAVAGRLLGSSKVLVRYSTKG